jgi:competence protein ComEC
MPIWIITFFLGVFALTFCRNLPNLYWILLLLPLVFVWFKTSEKVKKIIFHLLVFGCGFSWALLYTNFIVCWSLPSELETKKILVIGHVASPPSKKPEGVSFEFKTTNLAGQKVKTKLKLGWYNQFNSASPDANAKQLPQLKVGDKWQFLVRLKRPHGVLNPGGFDLEKHLLIHHVRATGYVVDSDTNQLLAKSIYYYPFSRLRQYLIDTISSVLPDEKLASIIIAFVTGYEDKISQEQWKVMRDTGTSYLVAIAGLHIGLVATIAFLFIQFVWRFLRWLPLIIPAKEAGIVGGLVFGFIYGVVSGFSIPTQRSLVMLVMFSLAILFRCRAQSWNAWLWSLFIVLIINPLSILTMGFWLSFGAVSSIIYVTNGVAKSSQSHLKKFWRMQYTVTLALLPLTLLFFKQFSFITIIANLIAMPSVCLVIVPMSLLGAIFLLISKSVGTAILLLGAKLLHVVWWWLTFLSQYFSLNWYHPVYNWWVLITACIGVLIILAPRGFGLKSIGLIWLIPLIFYTPPRPKSNGDVRFTVLDVGQGLAAVVQTKNHLLLYDTGPKFLDTDAGATAILPYLQQRGINKIDTLVISHGDTDHSGGALSIFNSIVPKNILTSVPEKYNQKNVINCRRGQRWYWDGVDFYVLSPPSHGLIDGNNRSCVLKIVSGDNSILLPGDIEKEGERFLSQNHQIGLKSTILVAPHHGSATSSTEEFIAKVEPRYVVFPVGYQNRFHFPNKKIIARYQDTNATLINTSKTGAITFEFNSREGSVNLKPFRDEVRRFWND